MRLIEIEMTEMTAMASSEEPYTWVWVDATYLRNLAQRCSRIARDCPHRPTSHALEEIGVELAMRAAELDDLERPAQDDGSTDRPIPPGARRKR